MITIVKDKDLIYDVKDYDIVLVGVNIMNSKGNGFQNKVYRNFPDVYIAHRDSKYGDKGKLGTVSVIPGKPTFCLCYISKGRYRPDKFPDAVEYDSLEECLTLVTENFKDKKIASTIMGWSVYEGGGDKKKILNIFKKVFKDMDITLYDYEQVDWRYEENDKLIEIGRQRKEGEITTEEFYERKKRFLWEKEFGIYTPCPEDKTCHEIKKIIEEERKKRKNETN